VRRDTRIVFAFVGSIPVLILGAAALCTWAISAGASMQWRLLFRLMCHGRPERCLELLGTPMPICARCTGIYLGMVAGLVGFLAIRQVVAWSEKGLRSVAMVAIVPLAIDGLTQLSGLRESTNELRVATGLVAGLAFGLWILSVAEERPETAFTNP
jgi:uncharacterized membrane protein